MAESFEYLDNNLRDWAKDKVQKDIEQAREEIKISFFLENDTKIDSGSLTWQSGEIKPNTKLVLNLLLFKKPLLRHSISKIFMTLIYFKNSTFFRLKIIADTD